MSDYVPFLFSAAVCRILCGFIRKHDNAVSTTTDSEVFTSRRHINYHVEKHGCETAKKCMCIFKFFTTRVLLFNKIRMYLLYDIVGTKVLSYLVYVTVSMSVKSVVAASAIQCSMVSLHLYPGLSPPLCIRSHFYLVITHAHRCKLHSWAILTKPRFEPHTAQLFVSLPTQHLTLQWFCLRQMH